VSNAGNVGESGADIMSDAVKEQLSACLDGELPRAELDLLLKRLGRDAELRDSLGRYALISEVLQADKPVAAPRDFTAGVMAIIENEPLLNGRVAVRVSPIWLSRLRPVVGMAVAAGVAAIAVFSVQRSGVAPEPQTVAQQTIVESQREPSGASPTVAESPSYVVPSGTSNSSFVPAARLTNYVVAHSEYSSPLGRRSMLSGVLAEDDAEPATVITHESPAAPATDESGNATEASGADQSAPAPQDH
jgi:sigma-E factor negative regulatory protein RseA